MALPVAHAAIVEGGIARDMIPRVFLGDAAARLADDDGQFALIVEADAFGRADHRLAIGDQRVIPAVEDRGMLLLFAPGFLDMAGVVEADAQNLVGIGDDGQQHHILERITGAILERGERVLGEGCPQIRRGGAGQIDHGLAFKTTVGGSAIGAAEADVTHGSVLSFEAGDQAERIGAGSHSRRKRKASSAVRRPAKSLSEMPHWSMRFSGQVQSSGAPVG